MSLNLVISQTILNWQLSYFYWLWVSSFKFLLHAACKSTDVSEVCSLWFCEHLRIVYNTTYVFIINQHWTAYYYNFYKIQNVFNLEPEKSRKNKKVFFSFVFVLCTCIFSAQTINWAPFGSNLEFMHVPVKLQKRLQLRGTILFWSSINKFLSLNNKAIQADWKVQTISLRWSW